MPAFGAEITDGVAVRSVLHSLAEQEFHRYGRGAAFSALQTRRSGLGLIARTPLQLARTAVVGGTVRSSVHLLGVMAT